MIKHHGFFKVHLPIKDYDGKNEGDFAEIMMEEFYLFSEGKWTKDYESVNPKKDEFEITLYPSIVYAANKLGYSESKKFQVINDYIDNSFVNLLECFSPLYKCTSYIEYHLYYYSGEKEDFYKHIKYQILSIVKNRKLKNKDNFDYENLELTINDWLEMKKEVKENKYNTNIKSAKNVYVNNNSKIKTQAYTTERKNKTGFYSILLAILGIIIAIIVGWKEILNFFNI
ncbi:hypothetical protein [Tenacibaculum sp. IB213877]|uniref:hypothetical protein n=1 Tax=Tenacibaculum sp. IB213877 TaxID=3097351 RepID=UPI002A5AEE5F|nr:hypothetical protein [Tenacibaculum sp. IB213877]MDY0780833.1 hypothetical protein [Tenacibaculum sp. IB213877]